MPTGYTADVEDGTITELKDFALKCARAIGYLIRMRDAGRDAPIEEMQPSTYHSKAIDLAEERLSQLTALTDAEWAEKLDSERQSQIDHYESALAEDRINNERYALMLDKVQAWTPPTPNHQGLKDFMIQQLETSMGDSSYYERALENAKANRKSLEQFKTDTLDVARRTLYSSQQAWGEEIARVAEANAWVQALRSSLEET